METLTIFSFIFWSNFTKEITKNQPPHRSAGEIIRILTEFSNTLRPMIPDILQSYEFLAEIDFIRAKAHFAIQTQSIKPSVERKQLLDWSTAIHPLLQLSLAKQGKKVVPLDIELNRRQRILLISGPNAGGKSVCLKTVGLLQYMLQCGMPIPVHERSHAGIFSSIFIGMPPGQNDSRRPSPPCTTPSGAIAGPSPHRP